MFYNVPVTWESAKQVCQSRSMVLATVLSAEENFAICNAAIGVNGTRVWLGATDAAQEGSYRWIDNSNWGFSPWGPNEPGDCCSPTTPHEEDCLMLFCPLSPTSTDQRWHDAGCASTRLFVCSDVVLPCKQIHGHYLCSWLLGN